MSTFTPLLSPAKSPSGSVPPKGKWRPWSVHVNSSTLSRTLCGQLNKLTNGNFDVIANRIAQLAWTVELSADRDSLIAFVRTIFHRGATDAQRQLIHAVLCQRIVSVLETERSRWRKVDILNVGSPFQSFETVLTLLVIDEYNRVRGLHIPEKLEQLMGFLGELLAHGLLSVADMSDILASLLEGAKRNDEHIAVATCRFILPITLAFNATQLLDALHVKGHLDQVLKANDLSPMVRYLLMGILERVTHPTPRYAFTSVRRTVDIYSAALDEYYIDDDDDANVDVFSDVDEAEDNEWMQRDCEDWSKAFLLHHDQNHLCDILHSLRPAHRKQLLRCLVTTSLYSNDAAEAACIGSLHTQQRISELCIDGKLFDEALCDELAVLQDVRLDVPNVVHLMARILHSTGLDTERLTALINASMHSHKALAGELIAEICRIKQEEHVARAGEDKPATYGT